MTLQVIVGLFFISSFVFDSMWIKQFFFKILFSVCQLFLTELEWCFCPTEDLAIIISVFHSLGFQYVNKLNRKLVTFLTIHYIILNLHKLKKNLEIFYIKMCLDGGLVSPLGVLDKKLHTRINWTYT